MGIQRSSEGDLYVFLQSHFSHREFESFNERELQNARNMLERAMEPPDLHPEPEPEWPPTPLMLPLPVLAVLDGNTQSHMHCDHDDGITGCPCLCSCCQANQCCLKQCSDCLGACVRVPGLPRSRIPAERQCNCHTFCPCDCTQHTIGTCCWGGSCACEDVDLQACVPRSARENDFWDAGEEPREGERINLSYNMLRFRRLFPGPGTDDADVLSAMLEDAACSSAADDDEWDVDSVESLDSTTKTIEAL